MLRTGARHPDAAASTSNHTHRGESPVPISGGAQQLYATLSEYLQLEHKFQPRLYLPADPEHGEVSSGARDGAAHVLKCLKVWYDLPADVLINAINLFDRFLTKMKVRPCHVPCITVSCMNIAIEEHAAGNKEVRRVPIEDLVSISQSACTTGDVSRMSRVLVDKLGLNPGVAPVTLLGWVRVFRDLLSMAAAELDLPPHLYRYPECELVTLVEIVSCDASCANTRTCELALVLICYKLECQLVSCKGSSVPDLAYRLFDYAGDLQRICNMSEGSLLSTRELARTVLVRYEGRGAAPHRQRLLWRLSERTLKVLRPTDRLTSLLPTIQEQHLAGDTTARTRSGSESSESEETSDWPRSPVLPVYCDN